jgi:arsenate reductase
MAEAFLNQAGHPGIEAYSAGLEPSVVNPLTIKVMHEKGVDLSEARSKSVTEFLNKVFIHQLITVCSQAEKNCPAIWPGVLKVEHWAFDDPAAAQGSEEERLQVFRRVRDEIELTIKEWLAAQE